MEDLFAKSIKLLSSRSIYNKVDKDLLISVANLFSFAYDNQNLRPNILKLLRFCDEVDPTGFNIIM